MIRSLATPALLVLLTLAGCSHDDGSAPPSADGVPGPATTAAPGPTPASLPAAAPPTATVTAADKPFDQYRAPADDAVAWVATYYAAAGTPPDYPAVAARLDPRFQETSDAFARRDAVTAIKAKLDAAIAVAKANPYVRLPPVLGTLPDYDLEHGQYDLSPLIGPDLRVRVADGAASVSFAPSPSVATYTPASEADARQLEHAISSNPLGRKVQVTVYGKVIAATLRGGEPQLTVMPSRVVLENYLIGKDPEPLFTATVP